MSPAPIVIRVELARAEFSVCVDVELPARGITVVYGASGSGKTSLLRCVAGLERARGHIDVSGDVWQDDDEGLFRPTWQRPIGYVFQEASLFDHLDVAGNLRYGLVRRPAVAGGSALEDAVTLLGIRSLMARRPAQLSGGERQRVAIARALATRPRMLLLDEPLASIDLARRNDILPWLERMRDDLSLPILYVTHSADELVRLADHVVALERGQVLAAGATAEVLAAIDTPVLATEEASALLRGTLAERDREWHLARVGFDGGSLWLRDTGLPVGQSVRLRVLARDVSITTEVPRHTSIQNHFACVVDSVVPDTHPSQVLVRLRAGESVLLARVTRRAATTLALGPGRHVWAQVKSVALIQ